MTSEQRHHTAYVMLCVCCGLVLLGVSVLLVTEAYFMTQCPRCAWRDRGDGLPNGYYVFDDRYFSVWVEGQDFEQINKTYYHEACHALIHEDYEHFCVEHYFD